MKVICVNTKYYSLNNSGDLLTYDGLSSYGKEGNMFLTIHKTYDVLKQEKFSDGDLCYKVVNDKGDICWYSHGRFLLPIEEYRQEQLEKII